MHVTYLGQACTLIEAAGRRLLVDPWLTEGAYFGTWYHTHLLADAGISPATLPRDVDLVFLSHEHQDHVCPETLAALPPDVPVVVCRFSSDRFRRHLERLGLRRVHEVDPGRPLDLGDGLTVTVLATAEYTNDAALLVEGDGCRLLNETDCKLSLADLEAIAAGGLDVGFFMFSGANWFPTAYEYDPATMAALVARRRAALLRSFVERVRRTRPRVAVPSAGPCTALAPELLHLNSAERGIFIDPREAVAALERAALPSIPLLMAAGDTWDQRRGYERRSPDAFHGPRADYVRDASARLAPAIAARRAAEAPAGGDFAERFVAYFGARVAALSPAMRRRIGARVLFHVTGPQGGDFTVDFAAADAPVRPGAPAEWTYRIEVEDHLLYPVLAGRLEFLEDLLLSLRVRLARRPDAYNEPLYHFFYDPDPRRLDAHYARR
jgi:L-ascorbate metabolism protein UlaG (beta-lactamase superfamily)